MYDDWRLSEIVQRTQQNRKQVELHLGSEKLIYYTDDNQPYPSNSCIGSLLFMKIFRLISRENSYFLLVEH